MQVPNSRLDGRRHVGTVVISVLCAVPTCTETAINKRGQLKLLKAIKLSHACRLIFRAGRIGAALEQWSLFQRCRFEMKERFALNMFFKGTPRLLQNG